jgi:formylglycine-generating enzyme required for sulfatase activity
MSGKIFINYRREQTLAEAQHLASILARRFGKHRVFFDIHGIDGFSDWLRVLKEQVAGTAAMISVIGPGWLDARDKDGKRRLENPEDFVRFEIKEALSRDIPVLPVLLDGASLPSRDALPEDMRGMLRWQGMALHARRFEADAADIARALRRMLAEREKRGVPVWAALAAAAGALAIGAYGGQYALSEMNWPAPGIAPVADDALRRERDAAREAAEQAGRESKAAQARLAEAQAALAAARVDLEKARAEAGRWKDEASGLAARLKDAEARVKAAEAARDKALAAQAAAEDAREQALAESNRKRQSPPPAAGLDPKRGAKPLTPQELAALKPGDAFQECTGCPEMVVVPAGKFLMGSPKDEKDRADDEDDTPGEGGKQVPVTIAKPFAVGKFEVTFAEWDACVNGGGCRSNNAPDDKKWVKETRPVINVSWDDAQEYVAWLNGKTGTKAYRLLTEAEWEYAARAGGATRYSWGDDIGKGNANCDGCGSQWDNQQTAPAGSFRPNGWGLYDMHGNVWEWVQDCYTDSYRDAPRDGSAAKETSACARVLRGGSWLILPYWLRSADRNGINPDFRNLSLGFRLARTLNP